MADPIFAPIRTESLTDENTGLPTIRYAEYFENLASQVTATGATIDEQVIAITSQLQSATALVQDLNRRSNRQLEQFAAEKMNDRSQIAELQKQINDLRSLIS